MLLKKIVMRKCLNPSCGQNAQLLHAKAGAKKKHVLRQKFKWVCGFQLMGQHFPIHSKSRHNTSENINNVFTKFSFLAVTNRIPQYGQTFRNPEFPESENAGVVRDITKQP